MRALLVSNYFPPETVGGYELWCHDVAQELALRGHDVSVATARGTGAAGPDGRVKVRRILNLEVRGGLATTLAGLPTRRARERESLDALRRLVDETRPDVALVWGMWNVPRSVPALVEQLLPERTAYYLCDYWPTLPSASLQQLTADSRRPAMRLLKKAITRPLVRWFEMEPGAVPRLMTPICCSEAVRRILARRGVDVSHAQVVLGGIKVAEFSTGGASPRRVAESFRLLYLGRLAPEKGVHTVVRAMGTLRDRALSVTLDIVGTGEHEAELRRDVSEWRLPDRVRFRGSVLPADVPGVLRQYDALVFPSEWEEPFARTVLEAMAAGLPVIGTTTGGTGEILVDGTTGLTFPPGDANRLADRVAQLAGDAELGRRLAQTARQVIVERFTFDRMVDELESILVTLSGGQVRHVREASNAVTW